MKLSVVIISFNTLDLTQQCLDSLVSISDYKFAVEFEIVVVDNGSKDESVQMIRDKFPRVTLVETGENLGFSKANNVGVNHTDPATKYVLFLNSDTVVPNGTLSEMVRYMDERMDVGVATCRVDLKIGGIDMDCHRGFPTPWTSITKLTRLNKLFPKSKLFNRYNQGWKDLSTTHEVDAVVGAFMLVPREIGEKIGWWDEDYFLNGEDIDFCYSVKELGYKVIYHPAVSILHYRGASKGTRKESKEVTKASSEGKKVVANSSVDAIELFYDKHLREQYPGLLNFVVDVGVRLLRWFRLRSI